MTRTLEEATILYYSRAFILAARDKGYINWSEEDTVKLLQDNTPEVHYEPVDGFIDTFRSFDICMDFIGNNIKDLSANFTSIVSQILEEEDISEKDISNLNVSSEQVGYDDYEETFSFYQRRLLTQEEIEDNKEYNKHLDLISIQLKEVLVHHEELLTRNKERKQKDLRDQIRKLQSQLE